MIIQKNKKGFGLIEVLVSVVILIIILGALVFVGRSAMANSSYTQERAQAIYLAQEGIELTRQIRDTNWIDGSNLTKWNYLKWNGLGFDQVIAGNYKIDYKAIPLRYGLTTSSSELVSVSGISYTREVVISDIGGLLSTSDNTNNVQKTSNALNITSTVSWNYNGKVKSVSVSEILTNWRPNF